MDSSSTDLSVTFGINIHFQASKITSVNKFQGFVLCCLLASLGMSPYSWFTKNQNCFLLCFSSMIYIPTPHPTFSSFLNCGILSLTTLTPNGNCSVTLVIHIFPSCAFSHFLYPFWDKRTRLYEILQVQRRKIPQPRYSQVTTDFIT